MQKYIVAQRLVLTWGWTSNLLSNKATFHAAHGPGLCLQYILDFTATISALSVWAKLRVTGTVPKKCFDKLRSNKSSNTDHDKTYSEAALYWLLLFITLMNYGCCSFLKLCAAVL